MSPSRQDCCVNIKRFLEPVSADLEYGAILSITFLRSPASRLLSESRTRGNTRTV